MNTGRAVVFINWSMPLGFGHVGWGFEFVKGQFYFGAVELTSSALKGKGEDTRIFNEKANQADMISKMKSGKHGGSGFQYHACKFVNVSKPNQSEPLKVIATARRNGYGFLGNNCMDAVFNVVKAYANGNDKILPWPATHWTPRSFFTDIDAPQITIQSEKSFWGLNG